MLSAPSFDGASRSMALAQVGLNSGFDAFNRILQNQQAIDNANWEQAKLNNTEAFYNQMANYKTPEEYQAAVKKYGIIQSMNSAGGRCHDNARCESMWARMKEELFYSRGDKSEKYTMRELKTMIWRYYMSYWANRRICTANGGLPPAVRRKLYYDHIFLAA